MANYYGGTQFTAYIAEKLNFWRYCIMKLTRFQKIHNHLETAATHGLFESKVTTYPSYMGRLKNEGFEVVVLENKKKGSLVTINVSWKNACKSISPATLKHYVDSDIDMFPSPAFKLHVVSCKAVA